MKNFFLLAVLAMSAQSAFAQYQQCEVDMVYNNRTVVRTYRVPGTPGSCVEGLKECRKAIRLDATLSQYPQNSLDCVQIEARIPTPQPNPQPRPNPQPIPQPRPNPQPMPQPIPTYGVTVSGILEDSFFTMTARDASELYMNCLTDIRRVMMGSSDELMFSANNNRFISTSTSGWYNDAQICSILEQEARRTLNQTSYTSPIRIQGSLEREPFQILANSRAELLNGCIQAFTATRQGTTDEVTFSLNGAPFQRVTTSGWWNTPARACRAMILNLDAQIR